jgi:hypothetical protein
MSAYDKYLQEAFWENFEEKLKEAEFVHIEGSSVYDEAKFVVPFSIGRCMVDATAYKETIVVSWMWSEHQTAARVSIWDPKENPKKKPIASYDKALHLKSPIGNTKEDYIKHILQEKQAILKQFAEPISRCFQEAFDTFVNSAADKIKDFAKQWFEIMQTLGGLPKYRYFDTYVEQAKELKKSSIDPIYDSSTWKECLYNIGTGDSFRDVPGKDDVENAVIKILAPQVNNGVNKNIAQIMGKIIFEEVFLGPDGKLIPNKSEETT